MAKLSLVITPNRPNSKGAYMVYLQISAHYRTIQVPTKVTVAKEHWLADQGLVLTGRTGDPTGATKNVRLTQIKNAADVKILSNQHRVNKMDARGLKKFLLSEDQVVDTDFFSYAQSRITELQTLGRKKSWELLQCTVSKLRDYWADPQLEFTEINVRFLEQFEAWCLRTKKKVAGKKSEKETEKTMSANGVAVYMRNIRTIINLAIADNLTENYPFKKFKIRTQDTRHRNLQVEDIRKIRDYQTENPRESMARDFFMLQYFMLGINTFDLFWATPKDVVNSRLHFDRGKSGSFCNIKIEPEAAVIFEKYKGEKYLLWFADRSGPVRAAEPVRPHLRKHPFQYKDEAAFTKMINDNLSNIQKALSINPQSKITTYFARHSFSSIMRQIKIHVDDINQCLSHTQPEHKTTKIYIDEDFINQDQANRKLIDHTMGIVRKVAAKKTKKTLS